MNQTQDESSPGGFNPSRPAIIMLVMAGAFLAIYLLRTGPQEPSVPAQSQSRSMTQAQRQAAMNNLRDQDLVIGVVVNNKPKAYALSAVHAPDKHVYNNMQGDAPVTVTFCDLADCVQVFTRDGADKPLDVKIEHGASKDRKMVIKVDGKLYHQSTLESADPSATPFPLKTVPFTRTTWGEWRKLHPDSELFTGLGE